VIGLDTNVLVRYIVQDDSDQLALAAEVLESALTIEEPGYISTVVMAEVVWTLKRVYGLSDAALAAVIERILEIDVLVVEQSEVVFEAMTELSRGRASFPDAFIAGLARAAGCSHTLTFDKRAARLEGFRLLD
jgi:predicted nucleic-acid-binding protein